MRRTLSDMINSDEPINDTNVWRDPDRHLIEDVCDDADLWEFLNDALVKKRIMIRCNGSHCCECISRYNLEDKCPVCLEPVSPNHNLCTVCSCGARLGVCRVGGSNYVCAASIPVVISKEDVI